MQYKNKTISFVESAMKFMVDPQVDGSHYPKKYYVSVAAAKKAIDGAIEKKAKLATAKKATPVEVFEVDSVWNSHTDEDREAIKKHTVTKYAAEGVGRNRVYRFVTDTKNTGYGSYNQPHMVFGTDREDNMTRLFPIEALAKVQALVDKRNALCKQRAALKKQIDDLEGKEEGLKLSKTDLLKKLGMPEDL